MSRKLSAGLLLFRRAPGGLEVLLAHPGGPFFAGKELQAWGVPKGEVEEGEDPLAAARREFAEETGFSPAGPFLPLQAVRQKSGKVVQAWAVEGELDPKQLVSNSFELEWPRGSGVMRSFPEIDRVEWFSLEAARQRILPAQAAFLEQLAAGLPGG